MCCIFYNKVLVKLRLSKFAILKMSKITVNIIILFILTIDC